MFSTLRGARLEWVAGVSPLLGLFQHHKGFWNRFSELLVVHLHVSTPYWVVYNAISIVISNDSVILTPLGCLISATFYDVMVIDGGMSSPVG